MSIVAMFDWHLQGADVENAYLESDIDKEIYMNLPDDVYHDRKGRKIKVNLLKSLYGLKQAGELWN